MKTTASAFWQAIRSDRDHAEARINLGAILARKGQWDQALEMLMPVIEKNPDQMRVRYHLALAYVGKGDLARAAAQLESILSREDSLQAANNLALIYSEMGKEEASIGLLNSCLANHRGNAALHLNLGFVYQRIARFQDAALHFRKVVELESEASERSKKALEKLAEIGEVVLPASGTSPEAPEFRRG